MVDTLKQVIEGETSTLSKCYALTVLHKAILTGHSVFLLSVCNRVLKALAILAIHKREDPSSERAKDLFGPNADSKHAVIFHRNLLNFMKEWSEVHGFIEGNVSLFTQVLDRLEKRKVTFPNTKSELYPDDQPIPASKPAKFSVLLNKGKQLILYIGDVMQAQIEDKEIIAPFKKQIQEMQSEVQKAINGSPEDELGSLIDLNDALNQLNNQLDKATSKDPKVQQEIEKLLKRVNREAANDEEQKIVKKTEPREISINEGFEFSEKKAVEASDVPQPKSADKTPTRAKNPFRKEPEAAFSPPSTDFFTNLQSASGEFPPQPAVFATNLNYPNAFLFQENFEPQSNLPAEPNYYLNAEEKRKELGEPNLSPIAIREALAESGTIDSKMNELKQKIAELRKGNADMKVHNELLLKSNEEIKQKHLHLLNLFTEHKNNAEMELGRMRQEIALVDSELVSMGDTGEMEAENERVKQQNAVLESKIKEMQAMLPGLTGKNAKLAQEKAEMVESVESLRKTVREKGEVPETLESAFCNAKVGGEVNGRAIEELRTGPNEETYLKAKPIGAGFYSNDLAVSQPMINPVELARSQIEPRFKNALTSPKTIWYEDHILQIGCMRNTNKTAKTIELTFFFGNKMPDCSLRITRCDLGLYDAKSLKITVESVAASVEPLKQAACSVRVQVTRFFSTYNYFTVQYETAQGFRNVVTLKLPVNVLMLCEKGQENLESVCAKVQETAKSCVHFQLDVARLKSMTQVKQALSANDVMQTLDQSPGVFFAATRFPNLSNRDIQAIARVAISKNVKQCELAVYCSSSSFRDSIVNNLLDVLAAPKE